MVFTGKTVPVLNDADQILPAFLEKNTPIVMSSSNYYLPYCAVTIQSVIDHSSAGYNYDFLIMTTGIKQYQLDILGRMVSEEKNISIRIVNVNEYVGDSALFTYAHVSRETYFRLVLPWLFEFYDKMIFIDSDMIVKTDIAQLMQIDLRNHLLAAVPDLVMAGFVNGYSKEFYDYMKYTLRLKHPFDYFNAGLLVFHNASIREQFARNAFLKRAREKEFWIFDQDVLNTLCEGKVYLLDVGWNLVSDSRILHETGRIIQKREYIDYAPGNMKQAYKTARVNPKIIHYTDSTKPWHDPFEDLAEEFWQVAQRTPFYEAILYRMYEYKADQQLASVAPSQVIMVPQGHLLKRMIKRIIRIFLPYGTKRRAFVKKYYFRLRGWPV